MGSDFAAALAIEKRTLSMKNKEMLNELAMRKKNKKVPVADEEMLGIPKRHVSRPISESMITASLKKGCDYKNEGMLWCESLGRCYEPRSEDGSCMDKRGQLPTTITPLTASMMTGGATGATGGEDVPSIDVESADMIDAVKQLEKEGEKAEQLEVVDKENVGKLKDEVKIDQLLLKKARREGNKEASKQIQRRLDIAADTMAKKESDTIKAKATVGKVETTIKTVIEQESKRLMKEKQQEVNAKVALRQRQREAEDKKTPGAVSDAEQQKDEVLDIQQVEQSEKEKLNRAQEALNTIKSKDVDGKKKEEVERQTKSVLDTVNEDDKPSTDHISVLKRFPKRLRSKVSLTLGGCAEESFDEESKLQVRNVIAEIADVDVTQVNILS